MKDKNLITEHNVDKVFACFKKVIKNSKKVNTNDLVSLFFGSITNKDEYYLHPTKKNTLITPNGKTYSVNGSLFTAFRSHFQSEYSQNEKARFAEISDRLIEDTTRNNNGQFYTPTPWADYAHKMISEQFGEDWKDEYVVWDCACGTKNLTRDYRFKELYCSTLEQAELDISKNYNQEATSFVFDFLNEYDEDLERKAPGLMKAIRENKKLLFFINPPYGVPTGSKFGGMVKGITTSTMINSMMKKEKIGVADLLKQFLYRICKIKETYNLSDVSVACFTKPSWLLKKSGKSLRNLWFKHFKFETGIMFQASEFADVSGQWGITFNLWSSGKQEQRNDFIHTLVKRNDDNEIVSIGEKDLYNIDGCKDINDWLYSVTNGKPSKNVEWVGFRSTPLEITEGTKINKDTIGVIANTMTCVSLSNIFFAGNNGGRWLITPQNFKEGSAYYCVKIVTEKSWINDKDEYLAPDENNPLYKQFLMDCTAYSLFVSQVSLRNVALSKLWNIKNEFFFMSKQEMEDLANTYSNQECYNDVHTDSDRYVYKYLEEHYNELSDDAKDILESARELIRKSFKYREMFNEKEPKYQINNWDAGWYQVKALLKMYMPDDLKAFQNKYKTFANRLRPLVYELGFLKKQLGRENQEAGL